MKISLSWLKRYVILEASVEAVEAALMSMGFEVEGVEQRGLSLCEYIVVGEVLERKPHPNADRLSVCRVQTDAEGEPRTIVCGASNYKVGDRVPVALPGALLPGGVKIKKSKLRGFVSEGMMCSACELGLGDDSRGLLILEQRPEVGVRLHDVFRESDTVFDIEVTPNRPDCLSYIGVARELAAYFGQTCSYPEIGGRVPVAVPEADCLLKEVAVEDEAACPLYTASSIRGVTVGPSPKWLRQALESVGLRSVNNVVDATNFVMLEWGQPFHVFDAAEVRGQALRVRRALDGETLRTLDDKRSVLSSDVLVVADAERPLVIAGIMGGVDTEVNAATRDIILEAACFDPLCIRRTGRMLSMSTESAYRFERGVDGGGVAHAARRAIDLIIEVAGGEFVGPTFTVGDASEEAQCVIEVTPGFIRERCGFGPDNARIRSILESLELSVSVESGPEDQEERWRVVVPSFRRDLERPIDLVEEFLRVYGTDRIPSVAVQAQGLHRCDDPLFVYTTQAADFLCARGFYQCLSYSLRSEEEVEQGFGRSKAAPLRLSYPMAGDQSHLRSSLIPGLLDVLKHNQAHRTGGRRFFEIGRVFREREGQVHELLSTAFIVLGPASASRCRISTSRDNRRRCAWLSREPEDFYTLKRLGLDLIEMMGVSTEGWDFQPLRQPAFWQDGHSAFAGNLTKGFEIELGVLSFSQSKRWGSAEGVLALELVLLPDGLQKLRCRAGDSYGAVSGYSSGGRERPRFHPFSAFPSVGKDLALLVEEGTPAGHVRDSLAAIACEATNGAFAVEGIEIFDVYRGEGLPDGHKSLAFSLTFRASDRTLSDTEVNRVFDRIQKEIGSQTSYQVRSEA